MTNTNKINNSKIINNSDTNNSQKQNSFLKTNYRLPETTEETYIMLIKFGVIVELIGLFLPWIIIMDSTSNEWIGINGLGFPFPWKLGVFSPTLLIIGIFFIYTARSVWQNTEEKASWSHLKPAFISFIIFSYQLLSKRQEAIIYFYPNLIYRTAVLDILPPHGIFGTLWGFFGFIVQNGAIFGRNQNFAHDWFKPDPKLNSLIIKGIIAYLFPFFFSYDGDKLQILMGIGYGLVINENGFCHGVAFFGGLANLFQVAILLIIIGNSRNPRVKSKYIIVFQGSCLLIFATLGYAIWRVYIPGGEIHSNYPPLSPIYLFEYWVFANVFWDLVVNQRIAARQSGKIKMKREQKLKSLQATQTIPF